MSAGNVTIADDGTATKSGLAEAIYDQRLLMVLLVQPPGVVALGPDGVPLKRGIALDANALAIAIWTYLQANGEVTGTIKMWGTASAPSGYLLCDGAAVSRTTYAALFAVLGITFGAGNGATTFNLPDLRGRAPIGSGTGDAAGATAHALGSKTGTETHTLVEAELASHTHAITDPEHSHSPNLGDGFLTDVAAGGDLTVPTAGSTARSEVATAPEATGITIDAAGSGTPHNNMQPSLTVNFIVKT